MKLTSALLLALNAATAFSLSTSSRNLKARVAPFGEVITTCSQKGVIALTFDDGPYVYTSKLLDLLDKYNVKATFFVVGYNFDRSITTGEWPAILQRMVSTGHQVASHTWSHQDLDQASEDLRISEMKQNEDALRTTIGKIPTYMRPPYGACSVGTGCVDTMTNLGYHIVNWEVDTRDWENNTPDTTSVAQNIFSSSVPDDASRAGPIILSHDVHQQTVDTLAEYEIQDAMRKGYRFVTVGECLGDVADQWYRQ
jgi:peptidoglycan/xylan/chitin deacetylase (PgdA/CDA1 family)